MLKAFLFIILSIIFHGAIFSISYQPVLFINETGRQGSSSLVINLLGKPKEKKLLAVVNADNAQNKKYTIKKIVNSKKQVFSKIIAHESKAVIVSHKPKNIIKSPSTVLSDTLQINEVETLLIKRNKNKSEQNKKIIALLNDEISKYFYYPKSARRKNYQGEVVLMFLIGSSGFIDNVKVEISSGHPILDEAAINALKKIKANKLLAEMTKGQSYFQYTLPVIYKIE